MRLYLAPSLCVSPPLQALRRYSIAQKQYRDPIRSLIRCMASQDDAAVVCVTAATAEELAHAQQELQQAGPLIAQRATAEAPEQHCTLSFPAGPTQHPAEPTDGDGRTACTGACGSFDRHQYFAALHTRTLGRVLFTAAATASTQVVVQENVAKLPDGLVFVTDKQFGGKGRGGNRWESPDGCLMFSAAARLALPGQRLPFVQYLVSLAVVQAVQAEAAQRLQGGSIDVRIKWPNDIYAGPLKLGGILCHSSYRNGLFHVIMGVGLNLSNRQPTTCIDALVEQAAAAAAAGAASAAGQDVQAPQPADGLPRQSAVEQQKERHQPGPQHSQQAAHAEQQQRRQQRVSRESLLAGILSRLEPMLGQLASEGFGPFEQDYYRHWLHSNQQVQLEEGGQLSPVSIRGLSPNGYLLAVNEANEQYELHPDGNSLDFFRGLVRKKLPA